MACRGQGPGTPTLRAEPTQARGSPASPRGARAGALPVLRRHFKGTNENARACSLSTHEVVPTRVCHSCSLVTGGPHFPEAETGASGIQVTWPKASLPGPLELMAVLPRGAPTGPLLSFPLSCPSHFRSCDTGLGPAVSSPQVGKCPTPTGPAGARDVTATTGPPSSLPPAPALWPVRLAHCFHTIL